MIPISWRQHFNADLSEWNPPEGIAKGSLEELELVLRGGYIQSSLFLSWAQEVTGLPIVDDSYFQIMLPNLDFWKECRPLFPWKSHIYPLCRWDDHLYVVCLFPPETPLPSELKAIQVLGTEFGMYQFWQKMNSQLNPEEIAPSNPQPQIPESIPRTLPPVKSQGLSPSEFSPDNLFTGNDDIQEETPNNEPEEAEGDILEIDIQSAVSSQTLNSLSDLNTLSLLKKDVTLGIENVPTTKVNENPPPHPPMQTTSEPSRERKAIPPIPPPRPSAPHKVEPIAIESNQTYLLEIIWLRNPQKVKSEFESFSNNLKEHFEATALFATNQEGTQIKFLLGGLALQDKEGKSFTNTLLEPSIFSIVSRTLKPYHGYVVPNSINESFFDEILEGTTPDHITMIPLIVDNELIGMLLGSGEKENYNRSSLIHFHEKSNPLTELFIKLKEQLTQPAA